MNKVDIRACVCVKIYEHAAHTHTHARARMHAQTHIKTQEKQLQQVTHLQPVFVLNVSLIRAGFRAPESAEIQR